MSTMKFGTVEEAITDGYRVFFRAETEDGRYYWQTGDNLRGEKRFPFYQDPFQDGIILRPIRGILQDQEDFLGLVK